MQKTSVFIAASLLQAQNNRNVLKCFVGFSVQQNKTFPCFLCDKQMPLGKPMFFAYVISKKRSKSSGKKQQSLAFILICKKKKTHKKTVWYNFIFL